MVGAAAVSALVGIDAFKGAAEQLVDEGTFLTSGIGPGGTLTYEMIEKAYNQCISGSRQPTHYYMTERSREYIEKFYEQSYKSKLSL
jgi:hypothetical protein